MSKKPDAKLGAATTTELLTPPTSSPGPDLSELLGPSRSEGHGVIVLADGRRFVSEAVRDQQHRDNVAAIRATMERIASTEDACDPTETVVREQNSSSAQRAQLHPSRRSEAAQVQPEYVSQKSSMAVFGIDPRRYLDLLRRSDCTLEVIRRGKLRLVERAALAAWLRELAPASPPGGSPAEPSDGADAVLRELGLVSAPKKKKP